MNGYIEFKNVEDTRMFIDVWSLELNTIISKISSKEFSALMMTFSDEIVVK